MPCEVDGCTLGEEEHAQVDSALNAFVRNRHEIELFLGVLTKFFEVYPGFLHHTPKLIHSYSFRIKKEDSLAEKIHRKWEEQGPINGSNLFEKITDLGGLRVLHLSLRQLEQIHFTFVEGMLDRRWELAEPPRAHTWDPGLNDFFTSLGLEVEQRPSYYTSVHYLLRERSDSRICVEIQIRTLLEEAWGEIDHLLRYKGYKPDRVTIEGIRALAQIVGAGGRLVDSLHRQFSEEQADIGRAEG